MPADIETVEWWEEQVKRLMEGEHHQEAFFRALITLTELGDVAKYVTHDPKLNPQARPHRTADDEVLAHGQLLIQVLSLAVARGISATGALKAGLKNWEDRDWRKREGAKEGPITGRVAVPGRAEGRAYVVSEENSLESFSGGVLVTKFLKTDQSHLLQYENLLALVTDEGGIMSHPAILAREYGIVAIVGTGNATERIPHGAQVVVNAQEKQGVVEIVKG